MKKLILAVALISLVVASQGQSKSNGGGNSGSNSGSNTGSNAGSGSGGSGTNAGSEDSRHKILKYPKVKDKKKKKLADQLEKEGSYYNAVEYYEDFLKDKPDNLFVMHRLAELNRYLRDYKSAEKYYRLEMDKEPKKYPNDRYWLAQVQKMNGKYDDAKKNFQDYCGTYK